MHQRHTRVRTSHWATTVKFSRDSQNGHLRTIFRISRVRRQLLRVTVHAHDVLLLSIGTSYSLVLLAKAREAYSLSGRGRGSFVFYIIIILADSLRVHSVGVLRCLLYSGDSVWLYCRSSCNAWRSCNCRLRVHRVRVTWSSSAESRALRASKHMRGCRRS